MNCKWSQSRVEWEILGIRERAAKQLAGKAEELCREICGCYKSWAKSKTSLILLALPNNQERFGDPSVTHLADIPLLTLWEQQEEEFSKPTWKEESMLGEEVGLKSFH